MIGDDLILCQITSQARIDGHSVVLSAKDFKTGNLNLTSVIKPYRIFTADRSIILYKVGSIKESKREEIDKEITRIFHN